MGADLLYLRDAYRRTFGVGDVVEGEIDWERRPIEVMFLPRDSALADADLIRTNVQLR